MQLVHSEEINSLPLPCSRTENNVRLSQCNFTLEVPKIGRLLLQLVSRPSVMILCHHGAYMGMAC